MAHETVVLLHGLWMRGLVMKPLAWRLRRAGFRVQCFSYPSVSHNPRKNARSLKRFVANLGSGPVHYVAHSLGGIVLMHYFAAYPEKRPGRVVLLGTPLTGSSYARQVSHLPLSDKLLGKSISEGLLGDIPSWQQQRQLGVIAGSRSMGIGYLLGHFHDQGDGAVLVTETQIPELSDHVVMPVSHSGMLFSQAVADQIIIFLRHGHFSRP